MNLWINRKAGIMRRTPATTATLAKALVEYAKNDTPDEDALVIPEDLSTLDDEALAALAEQAVSAFDTLYGDGSGLSTDDLTTLATLTEGIETVNAEVAARQEAAAERETAAAELAARVRPEDQSAAETVTDDSGAEAPAVDADGFLIDEDGNQIEGEDGNPVKPEDASPAEVDATEDPESATAEAVTASGSTPAKRERRISLSGVRSRQQHRPAPASKPQTMKDVVFAAGDGLGVAVGTGMDWTGIGAAVDRRLASFNQNQYRNAARAGRHLREQHSLAAFKRETPSDLTVTSGDPMHVQSVIDRAVDESRLPGGSLVASGGWCAPSEILYDLCETESRDGLLSVPEIGVSRGGIQFTQGPSFADIYNNIGFHFTEADDIEGNYARPDPDTDPDAPNVAGDKPCYKIECPDFDEERLEADGLCLTAGLLQSRGYPEVIARVTRGALVAHDHKMSANQIAKMVEGSTSVVFPTAQAGATAPLLAAIELQVEHYRYSQRLARGTTLEAIFPYWVHGVIRQDLSVRLGIDLIDVPDARIDAWFRSRGVNPQFVYDWQDITGDAASFTTWPTTVDFLLYAAGTWVRGVSDIITLDTIYDSVLLGQNDYTALFTEEAWLMAKRCWDSRVVTVSLCGDGATHGGVDIGCDLTVAAAA